MRRTVIISAIVTALSTCEVDAAEPWSVAATRTSSSPARVLLIYDMEGLSGQNDVGSFVPSNPAYPAGQRLLTDDVNAVVEGLFAGGARSVSVADGHGSSSEIDILTGELDRRAHMVTRSLSAQGPVEYEAIAIVGMHAKSGSGGFAAHTWTAGVEFIINGHPVNEAELIGLTYGERGVPVIFVSGDDHLGAELRTMPWIEYVTVKKATGITTAELYPLDEARKKLRLGAQRAIEQLPQAKVMKASSPVAASVTAFSPGSLRWLEHMPGINYRDDTVSFTAPDAHSAYEGLQAVGTAAMYGYSDALFRALKPHKDAKEIELRAVAEWDEKWERSERDRAKLNGNDRY